VSLTGGTAAFDTKNVGSGKTVTLSGASLTGDDANNYTLSSVDTTTANITAKSITGQFTAESRTYDATTDATVDSRTLTGAETDDDVSLTGGTAAFDTKNVGNGKTVTLSGASLTGDDATNYTLSSVDTTTADITARRLQIQSFTVTGSRTYDGTRDAVIATQSLPEGGTNGVVLGDDVTLDEGVAYYIDKTAAIAKRVDLYGTVIVGEDALNYELIQDTTQFIVNPEGVTIYSLANTTADITPKSLTGTFTAASRTYDGTTVAADSNRQLTGVVSLTDEIGNTTTDDVSLTGGTAEFDTKNVGNGKTVTLSGASLTGDDANNYTLSSVDTTTADIAKKDITGTFTVSNKTYDATNAATISGRNLVGVETVDAATVSLSGGSATFSNSSAADGKTVIAGALAGWSLDGVDAGNYTLTSVANTTANITKRDLIVTATASNKTYDRTTTASVTLSTDELAIDVGTLSVTFGAANFVDANAGDGKTVNVTSLSLSGVGARNYQLPSTSVTTTANIAKADLTRSFTVDPTKTYDGGTAATVTGSNVLGVLGDDNVTVSGVTATYATKNVATNKPVTGTGTLGGAQAGNYSITSVTPRTANITAKSVTATFTAADKTYDGTTAATISGSTIAGQITGDTVSLSGTATFSDKNKGNGKTVSVASPTLTGTDKDNYTLTGSVPSTTANITARTVTPVFAADNKLYDGTTDATLTFVSDDRVSPTDDGTAKLSYTYTAAFADSAVGTWTVSVTGITPVGTEADNYVVNSETQSLTAEILPIQNNPPEVETTSGNTTYTRQQPGVIVDAGVTVTDTDSSDFDTGFLQVTITDELSTGDVLAISSQGTGAGQISVTGSDVFYEGTQIGTITQDGTGGNPLVVTLNSAANAVNVQALARRVTFANTETSPSLLTRTVQFEVNDGDGGTSSGATKAVEVQNGNIPVVTTSSGFVTYTESTGGAAAAAITIDTGITVTDPDSANFN
ncbi:MAG: beta strand repeat-containing protein, partial [Planctomycetaceae bacterium]